MTSTQSARALLTLRSATEHTYPRLEWDASITNQYLVNDVVTNPVAVVDGHIVTSDGPGLGINVDEAKLEKYARAT